MPISDYETNNSKPEIDSDNEKNFQAISNELPSAACSED
jgi:hypothetical protein